MSIIDFPTSRLDRRRATQERSLALRRPRDRQCHSNDLAIGGRQPEVSSIPAVSERLQKFDQIGFLCGCEIQREVLVIVIDHRREIGRTAIMKIRWMLPESA
jgi:hypothetical protein